MKAELLSTDASEYRTINGYCSQGGCENWATHRLYDHHEKVVPCGKLCGACGKEIVDDYASGLKMYWTARPINLYHVGHVLFDTMEHAETYAARKNEEHQE